MEVIKSVLKEVKERKSELFRFFLRFFISFLIGAILIYIFRFFIENKFLNLQNDFFKNIIDELRNYLENYLMPFTQKGFLGRIFFIFFNNLRVVIVAGVLSLITFGIFSEIVAYINGFVVGIVIFGLPLIFEKTNPLFLFLFGILPHGIFEIFAFLLSLTFAHSLSPTKKGVEELNIYIKSYIFVIPLLFLASIIEVLITPLLLSLTITKYLSLLNINIWR
jgi:stage II sporulation protein M